MNEAAVIRNTGKLIKVLLQTGAHRAVKYLAPDLVVQATRTMWEGKFRPRDALDVRVTAGRPNYLARRFVRACRKTGEPFPVKKIQLRFPPKKQVLKH